MRRRDAERSTRRSPSSASAASAAPAGSCVGVGGGAADAARWVNAAITASVGMRRAGALPSASRGDSSAASLSAVACATEASGASSGRVSAGSWRGGRMRMLGRISVSARLTSTGALSVSAAPAAGSALMILRRTRTFTRRGGASSCLGELCSCDSFTLIASSCSEALAAISAGGVGDDDSCRVVVSASRGVMRAASVGIRRPLTGSAMVAAIGLSPSVGCERDGDASVRVGYEDSRDASVRVRADAGRALEDSVADEVSTVERAADSGGVGRERAEACARGAA